MLEAAASCKDGIRLPSVESHGSFKWLTDSSGCRLSNTYAYGTHFRVNQKEVSRSIKKYQKVSWFTLVHHFFILVLIVRSISSHQAVAEDQKQLDLATAGSPS